ncbi:MAG: DNA mismatch repair protein MutS [Planctomycetota bacterium]
MAKGSTGTTTPAMAQFMAAKQQHPNALLFFRMGDFYELFFDDAKEASRALGIALTSRSKGDGAIPMAGVPVRSMDHYLKRLVERGFRVAVCEQMEDPRLAKGVVKREVVRVVTPGTLTEDSLLEARRANHLAAIVIHRGHAGIAWVELSTGAFWLSECPEQRLADELARVEAAETLTPEGDEQAAEASLQGGGVETRRPPHDFGFETARRALTEFFGVATLEGFGVDEQRLGVGAAGALITYLQETQRAALPHIHRLTAFEPGRYMRLDRATRQSLELVDTMRGDGNGTPLLDVLDRTHTPMGARLLRDWVIAPLVDVEAIQRRQAAVAELFDGPALVRDLQARLEQILDLQRLNARVSCGRASGRDLVALRQSLEQLPPICAALTAASSDALGALAAGIDPLSDVTDLVQRAIGDEPPPGLKEGGLIRDGFSAELDELRVISRDSRTWLAELQAREAERTGIHNLKIGFNKVFGYYIEVTHGNRGVELPGDYVRKQTTKNAERYITDELKSFETKVVGAEERANELEYDLFCELREQVAAQAQRLLRTAEQVAELDVYTGLARVAKERDYRRPTVDDSRVLSIEDGRHPVIEATHVDGTFVPNDTDLDPPTRRLVLLTGPNMAGKSTYIRQNALIVLMAQLGSFVPAKAARVGVVDRIFTRVGAADDISRGASTFMVEMTETANILHNATARSLVILDEVGRGTSTFDGLALAWAIAEDLHDRIGCRSLFATHYHQLIDLAGPGKGVVNQRVAVKEWGDEIVFLHRIEEGGTDRSYGLHVGRLAGLPRPVLERARRILAELEEEGGQVREALQAGSEPTAAATQLSLFEAPRDRVLRELGKIDLESMTPLDAMQQLGKWAEALRDG